MAMQIILVVVVVVVAAALGQNNVKYIGETVRSIFDVMEFTDNENIPGILIFFDFKKAFDTVEWHYLFDCLKAFNFGPDLINWVKTFYRNSEAHEV